MNSYIISYDLVTPGRNYQPVYDYMKKFSDQVKPLQTVYLVYTNMQASEIRDNLKSLVDVNDKVIVVKLNTSNWATYNLPVTTTSWLHKH